MKLVTTSFNTPPVHLEESSTTPYMSGLSLASLSYKNRFLHFHEPPWTETTGGGVDLVEVGSRHHYRLD